ncbi:MAG: hypothetical protein JO266_19090 [Acidobacteria bacterium]|nr:hypothetical protein [Acidobacteriota bacterium]
MKHVFGIGCAAEHAIRDRKQQGSVLRVFLEAALAPKRFGSLIDSKLGVKANPIPPAQFKFLETRRHFSLRRRHGLRSAPGPANRS